MLLLIVVNIKSNIYITIALFFLVSKLHSQNKKIDSLRSIFFNSNVHDSIKLNSLNDLIWPLYSNNAPDSGIKYGQIAIKLAKKNNYLSKLTVTYRRIAICYTSIGNYQLALKYHHESLGLARKLKNNKDIGIALGNIGVVYMDIGDQTKALDYNLQSIELKEKLNDSSSIASNYFNIGLLYKDIGEIDKALAAMEKSIKISITKKNYFTLGVGYAGIGIIYKTKKDYKQAQYYYKKAIETNLLTENNYDLAKCYENMGSLYLDLNKLDSSMYYFKKNIALAEKINLKSSISGGQSNLALCYIKLKKYNEAIKNAKLSIQNNKNSLGNTEFCYGLLAYCNELLGNYKEAYNYQNLEFKISDSLHKINKNRDIVKLQIQHDYDKKILADSIKFSNQEKMTLVKVEVANAKLDKERTAIYALIIGLIGFAIFSYFIFNRFKLIKKQSIIIDQQKKETENQKEQLELKQKEILDSINYAKRIQYALLASDNLLKSNLSDYFVLFKPKDVVSGDFYWATSTAEGFIYVTGDCTGHGVPGAFMSLLNISKLSQTINENKITRPDLILNNVRSEIIKILNPDGSDEESKDGMDAVICKIDTKSMKLEFAAANNNFYILRNKELLVCKADKLSVGKDHNDELLFTYNEIKLQGGDIIYTFTDGYPDQFGGPKGKKFKHKQLEQLLITNSNKSMEEQKSILDLTFNEWKGDLEQIDDICIIGVRV